MRTLNLKERVLIYSLMALLLVSTVTSASSTSTAATGSVVNAQPDNPELDFTLVNQTGYSIKELYIGKTGTGDWAKEDEVLKGSVFATNTQKPIKFQPRETAEKWDIMVKWADGSGGVEWEGLDLTEINKLTLIYDAEKNKTSAVVE
jgi:hypothetical protein